MNKAFAIDYIRQAIYQTILNEHIKNPTKYIGSKNQLALTSFYEHLLSNEEIDRYVETVRDLNDQQNRTGLIANGTIVSPNNPTITNLNQCDIIPMDFTINFRCQLGNRDIVKETLTNVTKILKGRKIDIAELDNGKLFMVGTIANNSVGNPIARNGDYIGDVIGLDVNIDNWIMNITNGRVKYFEDKGITFENKDNGSFVLGSYFYFSYNNVLKVAVYEYDEMSDSNKWLPKEDDGTYPNIIFPPEHNSFTKWQVSISFESERCSEPRTLNADDYCDLSFGGSATLVNESVLLGNELTKLGIKRIGVKTKDGLDTTLSDSNYTWLEPLELPSGNNPSTTANQLISNKFLNNSHTDGITLTKQYTFVIDKSIEILKQLFYYGRYGIQTYVTPNMLYEIVEMFSAWGVVDNIATTNKINESVDIENTESDILTITLPMQIQGAND